MTAPDTRDSVELLPCPGCGGAAQLRRDHGRDASKTWIECSRCPIRTASRGWLGGDASIVDALASAWNRRALPQQAGGEDAEIREILFGALDRDRDNITTRNLVVVALNSLQRERERAETAEAALREAGRDAERYRWLRRRNELTGADDPRGPFAIETNADDMIGHPNAADLDAAIDAAIAGRKDGGDGA